MPSRPLFGGHSIAGSLTRFEGADNCECERPTHRVPLTPSLQAAIDVPSGAPMISWSLGCSGAGGCEGFHDRFQKPRSTAVYTVRSGTGRCPPSRPAYWPGICRPPDVHQPRERRSMRVATSLCSSSLPSRATARPLSTSARNHSAWSIERANRSSATFSAVRPVSAARRVSFASGSGGTFRFMKTGVGCLHGQPNPRERCAKEGRCLTLDGTIRAITTI